MNNKIIAISKPNILSVIWILFCSKLISLDVISRGIVDYALWGIVCVALCIKHKKLLCSVYSKIGRPFIILILLQIIGLSQLCTTFSITNIIATICVFCFVMVNAHFKKSIQYIYIEVPFVLSLIFVIYSVYTGIDVGNTLPGCMVFMVFAFVVMELGKKDNLNIDKTSRKISVNVICGMSLLGVVYICLKSTARTALFTIPIIIATFVVLSLNEKIISKSLFWIFVIGCTILTIAYINIRSFSWYDTINMWSDVNFGKQLDSSRAELWLTSLKELKWWQYIFGSGTGRLPTIERYKNASFHNSYIQLLMQSGILGLGCLVIVFYRIWAVLIRYKKDRIIRLVLSVFVGIVAYNCFECTLLQNKAFLGLIEWFGLCLGFVRVRQLQSFSREV